MNKILPTNKKPNKLDAELIPNKNDSKMQTAIEGNAEVIEILKQSLNVKPFFRFSLPFNMIHVIKVNRTKEITEDDKSTNNCVSRVER